MRAYARSSNVETEDATRHAPSHLTLQLDKIYFDMELSLPSSDGVCNPCRPRAVALPPSPTALAASTANPCQVVYDTVSITVKAGA